MSLFVDIQIAIDRYVDDLGIKPKCIVVSSFDHSDWTEENLSCSDSIKTVRYRYYPNEERLERLKKVEPCPLRDEEDEKLRLWYPIRIFAESISKGGFLIL